MPSAEKIEEDDAAEGCDRQYCHGPFGVNAISDAINFIGLCNEGMGVRFFAKPEGGVGHLEQEMHPAQEVAFRSACNLMSRYFGKRMEEL